MRKDVASWHPVRSQAVQTSGPTRVEVGEVDPEFRSRPVGFVVDLDEGETEPLTYEGDYT